MKTLLTLTATLALALLVAVPAVADITFSLTGTVEAPASVNNDGDGCSVPLTVETFAGNQETLLSAYEPRLCSRFADLQTGQRVTARGSLFVNDFGTLVPLVEWIEAMD